MWPNNGFGPNGPFPNNFNQDEFPLSPFAGPEQLPDTQYFSQQSMNQYDGGDAALDENGLHPETGLFNQNLFAQNQFGSAQFSSQPSFNLSQAATPNPTPTRTPTQINAKAAELKAKLLKGREGRGIGSSATPPVPTQALPHMPPSRSEGSSSSLRASNAPIVTAGKHEHELNVNDLISQYSASKLPAQASVKQETSLTNTNIFAPPKTVDPPIPLAKSHVPSSGSPTEVRKPASNGKQLGNDAQTKIIESGHSRSGSISDGEILEDSIQTDPEAPIKSIVLKALQSTHKNDDQAVKKARDDQGTKPHYSRREESPTRRAPLPYIPRIHDDRRGDTELKTARRFSTDNRGERTQYTEAERQFPVRKASRDDDYYRQEPREVTTERIRGGSSKIQDPKPPTLTDLLPLDADLREWLDITGYHNAPYRDKILNRRRAIAALDAQRDKLLAEMEAEERGGMPPLVAGSTPVPTMLPPPIPNNIAGGRIEAVPNAVATDGRRDMVFSNKRSHSESGDARELGFAKAARTDERHAPRAERDDEEYVPRRPRLDDFDPDRRSPLARRDSPRRYDSLRDFRDRDVSPGLRSYENRPARTRGYASSSFYEREDSPERGRPFEGRGEYKGRSFDPNYRGSRGRGRGGRGRGDAREFSNSSDFKNESFYGAKIASGKPYKDPNGFSRGGQGDTRYFIVKSFNEENVLKCIEDSVWTTQAQNGPVFTDAFSTCKNVILVFSINKSRAFQGYARMESLPGSVEVPEWQNAISWESAGAFRVRWLVICSTRFHRIGHLKNKYNENQAVLIGKDGQEIEENCGAALVELIDEEVDQALINGGPNRSDEMIFVEYY